MESPDFNQIIDRHNSGSVKWDFLNRYLHLNETDLLPMWVSDFDFQCPKEVLQALSSRIDHGIFGYSERDDLYYQAAIDWFSRRHKLTLHRDWFTSIEGVIPGLALLIQMLSKPGEGVIVQGPYYSSFAKVITMNGRAVIENPLLEDIEGYKIDYDHLEHILEQHRPPLLLLCNPHNPTGRCWDRDELLQLLILCKRYGTTVISDEIWADLILPWGKFTSILHLGNEWHSHVIAATSASKTFGLASLRISNFIIPDRTFRQAFNDRLNAHGLDVFNSLSMTAATAAYQYGDTWLDKLQDYLAENRDWFEQALASSVPWCRMTKAEGTYLAWLDCRNLGLDDNTLQQLLIQKAKIAVSMGYSFGDKGKGFIRINLGCPRQYLEKAISGLAQLTT
ncbi:MULTISPECIES: MalY/PatB family protein [Xenorhabdus]|uniref:cysteine-S-conjugate beta-lyase n=1 Tax=Xenorhabdus ehlersii TaxID=290111 RepID=A0A2D0IQ21_9GAMM|nr:MalY/PatB family protein [Xenorhabdus ehlersii]MBC8949194.1 aspartate aminotransferase [Xenorhabdus sp. TS4]PHM23981.1 aspartate aminotransferase [Xenorhabdus ehlersii]RKE92839.1 cystathionine beta-lyase [Xenorhabdus ehlersii]